MYLCTTSHWLFWQKFFVFCVLFFWLFILINLCVNVKDKSEFYLFILFFLDFFQTCFSFLCLFSILRKSLPFNNCRFTSTFYLFLYHNLLITPRKNAIQEVLFKSFFFFSLFLFWLVFSIFRKKKLASQKITNNTCPNHNLSPLFYTLHWYYPIPSFVSQ